MNFVETKGFKIDVLIPSLSINIHREVTAVRGLTFLVVK